MKLICLLLLTLPFYLKAQVKLNGKVKSIKTTSSYAVEKFGEAEKSNFIFSSYVVYDEKGQIVDSHGLDSAGNPNSKNVYKYDEKGNLIEFNQTSGSYSYRNVCKYDDKGNIVEQNLYNADGTLYNKTKLKYDESGKRVELDSYEPKGSLIHKESKPDEHGYLTESDYYNTDGSLWIRGILKYDEMGNIIELSSYKADGTLEGKDVSTYKFEYDVQKNWTKKVTYKKDKPITIDEREIEYYK